MKTKTICRYHCTSAKLVATENSKTWPWYPGEVGSHCNSRALLVTVQLELRKLLKICILHNNQRVFSILEVYEIENTRFLLKGFFFLLPRNKSQLLPGSRNLFSPSDPRPVVLYAWKGPSYKYFLMPGL